MGSPRATTRSTFALACAAVLCPLVHGGAQEPPRPLLRVVVRDPLPHLKRLLGAELLADLCADGVLAPVMKSAGGRAAPGRLWALVSAARGFVPERVELTVAGGVARGLGALFEVSQVRALGQAAHGRQGDAYREQERELAGVLRRAMDGLGGIDLVVELGFRSAATARDLFRGFCDGFAENLPPELVGSMSLDETRMALELEGKVLLADADRRALVEEVLGGFEIAEVLRREILDGLMRLQVGLSAERKDATLVFRLRSGPKRARPAPTEPGDAWLTADWDLAAMAGVVDGAMQLWDRWRGTALGKAVMASEDGEMLEADAAFARALRRCSVSGRYELRVDEGLSGGGTERVGRAVPPLADTGLAALVPPDPLLVWLTTHASMPDAFDSVIGRAASVLDGRELRGGLDERLTRVRRILGGLQRFVVDRGLPSFHPGLAVILSNQGADAQGMPARVPALAVIGRPRTRQGALLFADGVARRLAGMLGKELDEVRVAHAKDPVLGVPVVSLTDRADADPGLHMFMAGGFLVLSSSKRLGAQILQAQGDPGKRDRPVLGAGEGDVTEYLVTSGPRLRLLVEQVMDLVGPRMTAPRADPSYVREVLSVPLHLFGQVRMVTRVRGETAVTSHRVLPLWPWPALAESRGDTLLQKARAKVGAWPEGCAALQAEGRCDFRGAPARFRYLLDREGRFRMDIDGERGLVNTFDGESAVYSDRTTGIVTAAGLDTLGSNRIYANVITGNWARGLPGFDVQPGVDTESGAPCVELGARGAIRSVARLHPETGLLLDYCASAPYPLASIVQTSFKVDGYRAVGGLVLPHRMVSMWNGFANAEFAVESWTPLDAVAAGSFTQEVRDRRPPVYAEGWRGTLPLRRAKRGLLFVEVKLGGEAAWFLFDPFSVESSLGAPRSAKPRVLEHVDLEVGPWRFPKYPFSMRPMGELSGVRPAGVLGVDVLQRCSLELDFEDGVVRARPAAGWGDAGIAWTTIRSSGLEWGIDAVIEGRHEGWLHLVGRASWIGEHAVELRPRFVLQHRLVGTREGLSPMTSGMRGHLDSVRSGDVTIGSVPAYFRVAQGLFMDYGTSVGELQLGALDAAGLYVDGPRLRLGIRKRRR